MSPLRWKTYKLERHTQPTLGAELMSLARGIAECEWLRSLMAEALTQNYCLEKDRELREMFGMTVTIDNRPIYDHTVGDGIVVKDKRMAIDMLIVRRDIRTSGRPELPHQCISYPSRMAHRVTPGQTEVTPGRHSHWHTDLEPSFL